MADDVIVTTVNDVTVIQVVYGGATLSPNLELYNAAYLRTVELDDTLKADNSFYCYDAVSGTFVFKEFTPTAIGLGNVLNFEQMGAVVGNIDVGAVPYLQDNYTMRESLIFIRNDRSFDLPGGAQYLIGGSQHTHTPSEVGLSNVTDHAQVRAQGACQPFAIPMWIDDQGNALGDSGLVLDAVNNCIDNTLSAYYLNGAPLNNTHIGLPNVTNHAQVQKMASSVAREILIWADTQGNALLASGATVAATGVLNLTGASPAYHINGAQHTHVPADVGLGSVGNYSFVRDPGTVTANALVRWSGTTGYEVLDSGSFLSDTNILSLGCAAGLTGAGSLDTAGDIRVRATKGIYFGGTGAADYTQGFVHVSANQLKFIPYADSATALTFTKSDGTTKAFEFSTKVGTNAARTTLSAYCSNIGATSYAQMTCTDGYSFGWLMQYGAGSTETPCGLAGAYVTAIGSYGYAAGGEGMVIYTSANTHLSFGVNNAVAARLAKTTRNFLIGTLTDGMTTGGSLAIAQDLAHRGTKVGLFNTTPVTQRTHVADAAGGATVDAEARAAVNAVILRLEQLGAFAAA